MFCEICGAKLKVLDTRHYDGKTYRRAECLKCRKSVFSVEEQVKPDEAFYEAWNASNRGRYKYDERKKKGAVKSK